MFFSGKTAEILSDICVSCGNCYDVCRFGAILRIEAGYQIDALSCEGCGYCSYVCPEKAIVMEERFSGDFFVSKTRLGSFMVHARLGIGSDNSGKLVTKVKKEAKRIAIENNKDFLLIDGSPGIGCPVIASLTGADYVIFVTEPTVSGLHDLVRVYGLVNKFGIKSACIINKYDINLRISNEIQQFIFEKNIIHPCSLPYDESFTNSMTEGKAVVEYGKGALSELLKESWNKLLQIII